jgi:hypothetical protein
MAAGTARAWSQKPVKFEAGEKLDGAKIERQTPTGLQHSAQRCRDNGAATLGRRPKMTATLKGLNQGGRRWLQPFQG